MCRERERDIKTKKREAALAFRVNSTVHCWLFDTTITYIHTWEIERVPQ